MIFRFPKKCSRVSKGSIGSLDRDLSNITGVSSASEVVVVVVSSGITSGAPSSPAMVVVGSCTVTTTEEVLVPSSDVSEPQLRTSELVRSTAKDVEKSFRVIAISLSLPKMGSFV